MKVLGGILIAFGILVAGGSGLCSLGFLISMATETDFSILPLILVVGGIPFLVGLGAILGGRTLVKEAKAKEEN